MLPVCEHSWTPCMTGRGSTACLVDTGGFAASWRPDGSVRSIGARNTCCKNGRTYHIIIARSRVIRAISRTPDAADAFVAELELGRGGSSELDAAIDRLAGALREVEDPEGGARRLVETMATTWGATLAVRHGDERVARAYIASRIERDHGALFGTLGPGLDLAALARRAVPAA